ncbi:cytochrome c1, heme protein, mitochondrial [Drosophila grimshawi]|uniref:GH14006 n=1 Tax=Drosophila grimshawi TaxID=7222 RepID=B4JYI9_DROGR|nr:cytochrome c1, heme protein, mitochondrial [Drosophila grimshawi]EDV90751.1 GH14006 [Drosophila grimshawi]
MASKLLNFGSKLFKKTTQLIINGAHNNRRSASTSARNWIEKHPKLLAFGTLTGAAGLLMFALDVSVEASSDLVHPPAQNWGHKGLLSAIDKEGVRRGYQVYKEVCSSCHSLQYIAYRNLAGVCLTEEEAKAEAEGITVQDGPDEEGNYYDRPGRLSDYLPRPYANEELGRSANNGAYPPDLSYIVSARKGGEDYVFALLTGYCEPPAGFALREGLYFNPYFSGGAIAMGKLIDNEVVSYADEEVAPSASQLAKDVVTFLVWASEPEGDLRKILLIKVTLISTFLIGITYYIKRLKWSALKSRKIFYLPELQEKASKAASKAASEAASSKNDNCKK